MKTKYLDFRNCNGLLPKFTDLSFASKLEAYLTGVNESEGPLKGVIDILITQNINTLSHAQGSSRLCKSVIDVSQASVIGMRDVHTSVRIKRSPSPALLHTNIQYNNGVYWKTIIPLQFLLKGWDDATSGHQCYIHTISQNMQQMESVESRIIRTLTNSDDYYYVGITKRNWLLRLKEHLFEMHRGDRKKFHAMWRDSLGLNDVVFSSALREVNFSYEQAMNWEEENVKKVAYGPCGLNMIPGGFAGLRELHKLGIISRTGITLDEREIAINIFAQRYPRKGIPNPFIAALWDDDDFYAKVIGSRAKTLSREQVTQIRSLAFTGMPTKQIVREVRALNELQVKSVISGKTYTRYR